MRNRLRHYWQEFKSAAPGERFHERFQRRARERALEGFQWSRILLIGLAFVCILIAIPLMVLPGPAVLFYAIAGFLIAGESSWMAALLDRAELWLRRVFQRPSRHRLR